jgi:hypothetical protein
MELDQKSSLRIFWLAKKKTGFSDLARDAVGWRLRFLLTQQV